MKHLIVKITDDDHAWLKEHAHILGCSGMSELVRRLIWMAQERHAKTACHNGRSQHTKER